MKLNIHLVKIAVYLAAIAAFVVPMIPRDALAIPNYKGTVVAECTTTNGVVTNVTATVTAPQWNVIGLTYTFMPGNIIKSGASGADPSTGNTVAHFSVPPGTYTVTVGNPAYQATYTITAIDCKPSPCPKGQIEQTFPGTKIKYCCDHNLSGRSASFCCKREGGVYPWNDKEEKLEGTKKIENLTPAPDESPRK